MMRLVLCVAGLFVVTSGFAAPVGKTRSVRQLQGFEVWESGSRRLLASSVPGNVRRTFAVRFSNMTREEIAEVDVRLRVRQGGATTYRSRVVALQRFDNTSVPHVGSILPYNKTSDTEMFSVDYPGRYWTVGSQEDVEIVAIKVFDGTQDIHDIGHLFAWMVVTKNPAILARLAQDPAILKDRDTLGMNPTLVAFAVSNNAVQHYVLDHGGDFRSRTTGGSTIAHLAAFNTDPGALELVHEKGISTDAPSDSGRTPLFKAVQTNNRVAWTWLLSHGANPNRVDKDGRNPVYYTFREGNTQAFEALVRAGADPRYHNRNGWGWMHSVAVHNYRMLPYVLRAGGDVNDVDRRFGLTPLMAVAGSGAYDGVPWLVAHGANPDAKDVHGRTAYDYARESNTLHTDRFFRRVVERAQAGNSKG